ncbi:MAG TPA: hypothetical protein VGO40_13715 [Longimicrobium sp.]|jgi:hypothetical protein|nr:hypothetical protein [Longimicrobium sp.]
MKIDRRILFAAVPVLALTAAGAAYARRSGDPPPYRVSLNAMLFYSDRGTFSGDVIARPVELWNTRSGKGARAARRGEVLGVGDVRGEAGSYVPEWKVHPVRVRRVMPARERPAGGSRSPTSAYRW